MYILHIPNGTDPNEIHWAGSGLNVKYYPNVELFFDVNGLVNYSEINITSCIWPNYIPEFRTWDPILPEFALINQYSINIGSNISQNYSYTPFVHWQNSKFIFRAWLNNPTENNTWNSPAWININEVSESFDLIVSKVNSIGIQTVYFQAQLISHSLDLTNNDFYFALNSSSFVFINQNADITETSLSIHLVVNVTKNFSLSFYDQEGDNVQLKTIKSNDINIFIQKLNYTNFNIIMGCDFLSNTTVDVRLEYTDKYHTDSEYWKQIDLSVYIYASDPPYFAQPLDNLTITKWGQDDYLYKLPDPIDPDGGSVAITLLDGSPEWIQIYSNSYVSLFLVKLLILNPWNILD